jgi:hypothetical protein
MSYWLADEVRQIDLQNPVLLLELQRLPAGRPLSRGFGTRPLSYYHFNGCYRLVRIEPLEEWQCQRDYIHDKIADGETSLGGLHSHFPGLR